MYVFNYTVNYCIVILLKLIFAGQKKLIIIDTALYRIVEVNILINLVLLTY